LSYTYNSQVHNAEINMRLLFPSESPYWAFGWLWGVRYFRLTDDFSLSGTDDEYQTTETLDYQTTNNLVGPQLGLHCVRGWDRFQLLSEAKLGVMANFYTQQGSDVASGNPSNFTPLSSSTNGTDASVLFEISIMARFRMTDYLWLRAGYQFYAVTGLALGPRQLGTQPGSADRNGTICLDGLSLGLETAW
jgi:hypothetical protein